MAFFSKEKKRDLKPCTDEELTVRFSKTGDMDSFEELYQRYVYLVYGSCLKYLKNVEDSKDATNDIFEALIHKIPQQEKIDFFSTWLHKVVRNHCLSRFRGKNKIIVSELDEKKFEKNSDFFMENEGFLSLYNREGSELDEILILKAMKRLNADQKACIHAFFMDSLSYKEIAEKLNYPLIKVKSHIQNGKRNLRTIILELKSRA